MVEWQQMELIPLLSLLEHQADQWSPQTVLENTQHLGTLVLHQLMNYTDGKYRSDRNEIKGFFGAIDKFVETGLPISLEHFQQLVKDYRKRILPYPHYSGITIHVPKNLESLTSVNISDLPS